MVSLDTKKQAGFGAVVIVAAVLVVAMLGLLGWKLYSLYSKPSAYPMATANQATPRTGNTQTNTAGSTSTSDQATYLDIKELGIKIKLNNQISDAIYSIVPTTDGSKGAGISAQSLVGRSAACSPSNFTLGLIEATTTAPTYVGGQQALPVDNKTLFKFGDTYYWYRPPQNQGCLTTAQNDVDLISSKLNAFKQAFATVQLDN